MYTGWLITNLGLRDKYISHFTLLWPLGQRAKVDQWFSSGAYVVKRALFSLVVSVIISIELKN